MKTRNIGDDELVENAKTVAAGELVVIALESDAVFTY